MAAIMKMYITTSDRLPQLSVEDGQLIFVRDTKRIYLDYGSLRVEYSVIQTLDTDEDRINLESPVEGFYYIEETAAMWRYKDKWIQVTSKQNEPIYIGGVDSFPTIGKEKTLYVSEDVIYTWDENTQQYIIVSNKTEWKTISKGR